MHSRLYDVYTAARRSWLMGALHLELVVQGAHLVSAFVNRVKE